MSTNCSKSSKQCALNHVARGLNIISLNSRHSPLLNISCKCEGCFSNHHYLSFLLLTYSSALQLYMDFDLLYNLLPLFPLFLIIILPLVGILLRSCSTSCSHLFRSSSSSDFTMLSCVSWCSTILHTSYWA